MKYYREQDGQVWAFEDDGSQDEFITPPMVKMTDEEIYAHINPPPTPEELASIENAWRDTEMPIALDNITAIEFGEETIPGTAAQWKIYWLALRKWTDTNPDFPDSSKRPVAPQ